MEERQIDCPNCEIGPTFAQPETMWERWCGTCGAVWDIRSSKEQEADQ